MRTQKSLFGRIVFGILPVFLIFAGIGCADLGTAPSSADTPSVKLPLKVGFFVDEGSRGGGVIQLARLIEYSPQLQLIPLDGQDLHDGKLKEIDLLVIPGGSGAQQIKTMQETGVKAIRQYVADGGAYFGVCAGFLCALNRPEWIGLLPYALDLDNIGSRAAVMAEISEKGAKLLDIRPGSYKVIYSHGPVARRVEQPETGRSEELAVYKNSISHPKTPRANFVGTPAMLYGQYGKGKVIVTSFHPESLTTTRPIALGCIYAVTGVKPAPMFPVRDFRPLRVGYHVTNSGKRGIAEMLMLDRQSDLDVNFSVSIPDGSLEHLDVVVFPENGNQNAATALKDPQLLTFLERGGKVIAVGPAAEAAPQHPNVTRLADSGELLHAIRAAGTAPATQPVRP